MYERVLISGFKIAAEDFKKVVKEKTDVVVQSPALNTTARLLFLGAGFDMARRRPLRALMKGVAGAATSMLDSKLKSDRGFENPKRIVA